MTKDKENKPKKYKSGLSLGKTDMVKLNLSFEELVKRAIKVEVKGKKKEDKDKEENKKE